MKSFETMMCPNSPKIIKLGWHNTMWANPVSMYREMDQTPSQAWLYWSFIWTTWNDTKDSLFTT